MKHYSHITREFGGVVCRLAATTQDLVICDGIAERLKRDVYEHVHVRTNPEPTSEMSTYMIFVGGEKHEDNNTPKIFGIEVHERTRKHT